MDWRRRADGVGLGVEAERGGRVPRGAESASFDEHRFAGVISLTPHGGAHRRDVVGAFAVAARDGVAAASLERAADLWAPGGRVGVAEERLTRRSVVPAPHVVAALGPRPLDPASHATWVGAAGDRRVSRALGDPERCRTRTAGRRPQRPFVAAAGAARRSPTGDATARRGAPNVGSAGAVRVGARAGTVMVTATDATRATTQRPRPGDSLSAARPFTSWTRDGPTSSRQGEQAWAGVERDVGELLVRPEHERTTRHATGHGVDGESGLARRADRRGRTDASPAVDGAADRRRRHFAVAGERTEVAQRRGVRDAGQHDGRAEQREESVGRLAPSVRAWERSCRHASTKRPWPAPSLTMAGRSGMGAMLATSSRASRVGGPSCPSRART